MDVLHHHRHGEDDDGPDGHLHVSSGLKLNETHVELDVSPRDMSTVCTLECNGRKVRVTFGDEGGIDTCVLDEG